MLDRGSAVSFYSSKSISIFIFYPWILLPFHFCFYYLPQWGIFCFKFHVFAKETIFFIDFAIVFSFVVVFFLQIEVLNLATFLLLNLVKCLVVDLYSVLIISLKSSVMRKRGKNCCYRHTDK